MMTTEEKKKLLDPLTARERKFVHAMLECSSQTEAIKMVGTTAKQPNKAGSEMMSRPHVRKAYEALRDDWEEQQCMSFHEACRRLTQQARGNVSEFLDEDGNIDRRKVADAKLSESKLDGFEVEIKIDDKGNRIETTKLKMGSRVSAIQTLSKMKGWDKVEVTANVNINTFQLKPLKPAKDGEE